MRTEAYESGANSAPNEDDAEGRGLSTQGVGDVFADVLERNLNRRDLLKGAAVAAAVTLMESVIGGISTAEAASAINFQGITATANTVDGVSVAPGHLTDVLVRWGDPVLADAPPFNPLAQTADAQAKQFGYNCDFTAYMPLPWGSNNPDHGLLFVNHEYTSSELMFPGYNAESPTAQQVDIELAAHGAAIVEITRGGDGRWQVVRNSPYARRIHGNTTMVLTGPVRGHDWVKPCANPDGTTVLGTLNNCGGGTTSSSTPRATCGSSPTGCPVPCS